MVFLYARGLDVRGHSVADFAGRAAALDVSFSRIVEDLAPLDQYYIPTRYPNGLAAPSIPAGAFNRQDSSRALELADKALRLVGEKVKLLRVWLEEAERKERGRSRDHDRPGIEL